MESLVRRAFRLEESKKKTSTPWPFDEPYSQPFHIFENGSWQPRLVRATQSNTIGQIKRLALYSWNIDFMLPYPDSRMQAAISCLRSLVDADRENASTASVIFLQECLQSDLELIASNPWIRENFALSDLDTSYWQSGYYGTLSIIDRRLPLMSTFRVHYSKTRMERDALFSEILMHSGNFYLCNTHLESLALDPPYRPPQLNLAARWMHDKAVRGAILAGDLNAVQDFDRNLHTENNLKDAYLDLGGTEGDSGGHTWGQQADTAQRERFGTSRMDKILYCGAIKAVSFERFGADVVLKDKAEQDGILRLGFEKAWITDHLGVKAIFE